MPLYPRLEDQSAEALELPPLGMGLCSQILKVPIYRQPIEETSVIARTPRTCLVVWAGDHRQTPGGLRKTDEAIRFRRKLMKRPLGPRGGTHYIQPHGCLDGPIASPSHFLGRRPVAVTTLRGGLRALEGGTRG